MHRTPFAEIPLHAEFQYKSLLLNETQTWKKVTANKAVMQLSDGTYGNLRVTWNGHEIVSEVAHA